VEEGMSCILIPLWILIILAVIIFLIGLRFFRQFENEPLDYPLKGYIGLVMMVFSGGFLLAIIVSSISWPCIEVI
jgi:hypothetical protein